MGVTCEAAKYRVWKGFTLLLLVSLTFVATSPTAGCQFSIGAKQQRPPGPRETLQKFLSLLKAGQYEKAMKRAQLKGLDPHTQEDFLRRSNESQYVYHLVEEPVYFKVDAAETGGGVAKDISRTPTRYCTINVKFIHRKGRPEHLVGGYYRGLPYSVSKFALEKKQGRWMITSLFLLSD